MSDYPPTAPWIIERPVMLQRWDSLAFLHWPYPADDVAAILPAGIVPDLFDGRAWVGLIPFHMQDIRPRRVPKGIPWIGTFPETNVRTYVRDRQGRGGIWFCSLDITRLGAVAVARLWYRLPYCWSRMRIRRDGATVTYESRRRWPAPRGAATRIAVEVGEAIPPAEVSPLEHFLTARWALHTVLRRGLAYARVDHPAWPLHRAALAAPFADDLIAAAGLPSPPGEPLVHYSPGVDVRIERPETSPSVP